MAEVEGAEKPGQAPHDRLVAMARALAAVLESDRDRNLVLLIGYSALPPEKRDNVRQPLLWLHAFFRDALAARLPRLKAHPDIADGAAASLLSVIGTRALWGDLAGGLSAADHAKLATESVIEGAKLEMGARRKR